MTGAASSVPGPQLEQGLRGFNETDGVNGVNGIKVHQDLLNLFLALLVI